MTPLLNDLYNALRNYNDGEYREVVLCVSRQAPGYQAEARLDKTHYVTYGAYRTAEEAVRSLAKKLYFDLPMPDLNLRQLWRF